MKTSSCIALVLVGIVPVGVSAQEPEQPPPECQTRHNLEQVWSNAWSRGEKAVDQAFKKVKRDCERTDDLRAALLDKLGKWIPQARGDQETPACIAHGLTAGVYAGLGGLEQGCFGVCIADGEFIGELAAALYCELSIALGPLGLDMPLPGTSSSLCGERFEATCRDTFGEISTNYVNDDGASCLPFVVGEVEPIWERARDNQCLPAE